MTGRDRIVAMVVAVLVVLGAAWIMLVSPERKKANSLNGAVATAQTQLSSAEGQLAQARAAESEYPAAYAAVASLGKAVPTSSEVPSLIYELERASNNKHVEFASITSGAGTISSSSSGAAAAAASAGFQQMPFTFVFNGSFFDLEHLFGQLDGFAGRTSTGQLQVNGRLLTIQGVKLAPVPPTPGKPSNELTGTITATAYVLPASSASPEPAAPGASAIATSPTRTGSSAAPPAVVTP
jgi:Type II secretion system (T2SS), protein M